MLFGLIKCNFLIKGPVQQKNLINSFALTLEGAHQPRHVCLEVSLNQSVYYILVYFIYNFLKDWSDSLINLIYSFLQTPDVVS